MCEKPPTASSASFAAASSVAAVAAGHHAPTAVAVAAATTYPRVLLVFDEPSIQLLRDRLALLLWSGQLLPSKASL